MVSDVKARLIASDVEVTVHLVTSNPKLNRLQKNIEWTLKSNMTAMLTDNPDRERAGWTGDLQMVAPTLCYNLDVQAFLRRWLKEASLEQRESGDIPMVIPNWNIYDTMQMSSSAGWGDVVTILPWILYERYGDLRIIEECYPMMKKWVAYQTKRARCANPPECVVEGQEQEERFQYLWNADFNFGDWLTPSACYNEETGTYTYFTQTLCWLTGTYYYAWSTSIIAKAAKLLGKQEDAEYYSNLSQKITDTAIEEFYKTGRILESEYMGAQILALHMGFYPEGEKHRLMDRIRELIRERGMDTGFSSTIVVSDILCENGFVEEAYDFLLNERFPSWLYEVEQGATSLWESMQAIMPDGTRNAVSFIQPAYSSIGNWMVSGMGGIKPAAPGFQKILICPCLTNRLEFVDASYLSQQGEIRCFWKYDHEKIRINITVPSNTTADIVLPGAAADTAKESGKSVRGFEGLIGIKENKNGICLSVGSGTYCFVYDKRR